MQQEQWEASSSRAAATGQMQHACRLCSILQWVLLWRRQQRQVLQQQQQWRVPLWAAVWQCRLQLLLEVYRRLFCRRAASATRLSHRALAALMPRHILQDQQQLQQQQLAQQLLQDIMRHTLSRCHGQLVLLLVWQCLLVLQPQQQLVGMLAAQLQQQRRRQQEVRLVQQLRQEQVPAEVLRGHTHSSGSCSSSKGYVYVRDLKEG